MLEDRQCPERRGSQHSQSRAVFSLSAVQSAIPLERDRHQETNFRGGWVEVERTTVGQDRGLEISHPGSDKPHEGVGRRVFRKLVPQSQRDPPSGFEVGGFQRVEQPSDRFVGRVPELSASRPASPWHPVS